MSFHVMAKKMAFFLVHKNIVTENAVEVYSFGLELLIATAVNGIVVAAAALLLGVFWQSVLLLIPFMLIRSNAGGFHAETHMGCVIGFLTVYLSGVFLAQNLPLMYAAPVAICGLIVSTAAVLIVGALPHKNRPVSARELASYQIKCRLIAVCILLVGVIGVYFAPGLFLYYALGTDIAAGSLLAGWIKTKMERRFE